MPDLESNRFSATDWALLAGAAGIWGTSFLLMAIELEELEPTVITFGRVSIGAIALWLLPSARAAVPLSAWPKVILLGITWMAFPLSMFPLAQQWIDSSVAGMLNAAMPIATVAIAALGFGIATERRQLAGIAIGLVGIMGIAVPSASLGDTTALGVLLVLAAVISDGIAINVAVPLQAEHGTAPVLARALLVATILTFPLTLGNLPSTTPSLSTVAAALVLGAFGSGYAFVFASRLGQNVGPVRASLITYLVPIVSIVLGAVFRNEVVSNWAIAGTGLVLLGAWVTSQRRSDGAPTAPATDEKRPPGKTVH